MPPKLCYLHPEQQDKKDKVVTSADTPKALELSRKTCRRAPTQKGRIIRRRHTRSHLKVWEYFHKKPHIQLSAHSFYENNEWFLYFSLLLCRFYPRQHGSEPLWLSPRYVFDFLLLRKCGRRRRTLVLFPRRRYCLPPSLTFDACLTGRHVSRSTRSL